MIIKLFDVDRDDGGRKVLFCDIDGTIADSSHRVHHIDGSNGKKPDWRAFDELTHLDPPIQHVIDAVNTLYDEGWKVVIVTARSEWNRDKTEMWLETHGVKHHRLYMRNKYLVDENGYVRSRKGKKMPDARPDRIVKKEMLIEAMADGFEPDLIFDDRNVVVEMWQEAGYEVVHVREGDF